MRLQSKIALIFLPLAAAAGWAIIMLSRGVVRSIVTREVADRGWNAENDLAQELIPAFEARSELKLLPRLQASLESAGASYALAVDAQGVILAHTDVAQKGGVYAAADELAIAKPGYRQREAGERPMLDVWYPVWSAPRGDPGEAFLLSGPKAGRENRIGAVILGMPLEDAVRTEQGILRQVVGIVIVIGGLALALALLVTRSILAPVRLLEAATERISRGTYGALVPVLSDDELGSLARSFNRMSGSLAETTVSKDFLKSVTDHMADALIVLAPNGEVRMVNRPAVAALGRPEAELLGRPAAELFDEAGSLFDAAGLERLAREGSIPSREVGLVSASGARVPILLSASSFKTADGRLGGFIVTAKDMAEHKQLEARLLQSEKLSAVGQLAGGVAHEINNPLGVILGFAQSLARRVKSGHAWELPVRSIEREALRCKNLVQDLLVFSRQARTRTEEFDVNEAVESALSLVQAQARVRSVELRKDAGLTGRMRGDRNQIQQVVINLCSNAIDAMPEGGTLTVRTRRGASGQVILEIEDNGSGIPLELRTKIFEPFFTTKEPGRGTGLGLSLVHEIVAKHGGEIDLRSEVGRGTTFTVRLPPDGRHE